MKTTKRDFIRFLGAMMVAATGAPALVGSASVSAGSAHPVGSPGARRRTYLIRNGAVITVDRATGVLPRADVLVRNGVIEKIGRGLSTSGAEVIDATDRIVMPGFVNSHYHMWSALGRSFTALDGGFSYYPAKIATSGLYTPEDFYNSVLLGCAELANGGTTTVHNWSHNTRSPAHADAELRAHQHSLLRARYSYGHVDKLSVDEVNRYEDLARVRREWFGERSPFDGLVHLGLNLRGPQQSTDVVFHEEMKFAKAIGLPVAIHAPQEAPNNVDAVDYERRGYLGPDFMIAHYVPASAADLGAMARTKTPLSFATHSELRLSSTGDARAALFAMRSAGLTISLSSDATSIAPPDMFEAMRFTWNLGVPWAGTPSERSKAVSVPEVIEMATINGAVAMGLGDVTGSITEGKRADIILVRTQDLNMGPIGNIETAIVQSGSAANVDTVMVDGRIVKRNGRLEAYDTRDIMRRARQSADRIRIAAGETLKF
ncbi:amidohydrolase family protein [Cupriavidus basilensis]|uniref:Amidohydrolase family protein n=1 Tax=Cupriavidus basilensis TaxID=68895 RepID=A0ABT6AZ13_9BURK|nr:amidohydrolase family protein [Cupriavidus basilensis]MDF3837857.1 amidohydrolase family protein [Cupriavidus basilensis]